MEHCGMDGDRGIELAIRRGLRTIVSFLQLHEVLVRLPGTLQARARSQQRTQYRSAAGLQPCEHSPPPVMQKRWTDCPIQGAPGCCPGRTRQ